MTEFSATVERSSIAPDVGLVCDATVVEQSDDTSPAKVVVEVRNNGTTKTRFQTGPSPPFDPTVGHASDSRGRAFLLPVDGTGYGIPARETDSGAIDVETTGSGDWRDFAVLSGDCWEGRSGSVSVYQIARGEVLAPSDSLRREYVLLGHPDDACLASGTYSFTDRATVDDQTVTVVLELTVTREKDA